jgi:energy-coupling factor transporter ATP-binding protein EcfA2
VVFENPGFQFQSFTVKEELEAGLIYRGAGATERRSAISKVAGELELEPYLETGMQNLEASLQLAVLIASFLLLSPRLLVLDFSLTLLEKTFRERLLRQCHAPSAPALVVLSRSAEDLALVGSEAKVFILKEGKLKELSIPRDDPQVLEILEEADIRLPWYACLTAGLRKEGLASSIFYQSDREFAQELNDTLRRRTGKD